MAAQINDFRQTEIISSTFFDFFLDRQASLQYSSEVTSN